MSCVPKSKSFYEEQARKKMLNDPQMRKWYEDVVSPVRAPRVQIRKPSKVSETPTKICVKCGIEYKKPPHATLSDWEVRQFCTRLCRFNQNYETMSNVPKSN